MKTEKKHVVIGVRFDSQELAKLDALAQMTERNRADVLRYMVRHAEAVGQPVIILRHEMPLEEKKEETLHVG